MKENKIKTTWNNINEKHPKLKRALGATMTAVGFTTAGYLIGYKVGIGEIKITGNQTVTEAANELVDEIIDEVS